MCEKGDLITARSGQGGSSESDMADPSQGGNDVPKCYPKWRGKPVYDGNKEAMAWTLCSTAVLINYIGIGAFFATTVLQIATSAYNCHERNAGTDVDLDELCGPRITFIKPSSLLTSYVMVITCVVSFLLPFIGAVVDHTKHRLLLGRVTSLIFIALLFPLMFLDRYNYLIMLSCHGCSVFFGWFLQAFYYAYLPELTDDELKMAHWTNCITIWSYGVMFIYLVVIIGVVRLLDKGQEPYFTSRFSTAVIFGINAIFLQVSWWFLFGERKPLHEMPENSSLCTIGFKQIYKTASHIWRNYSALKWYYLHITLANSGWQAFGIVTRKHHSLLLCVSMKNGYRQTYVLAYNMFRSFIYSTLLRIVLKNHTVTYLTSVLEFTPFDVGIAVGCSLLGSIPGAMVGTLVARKLDPLRSSKINLVLSIICVTFFAIVLNSPGQNVRTYIYLGYLGFNGGWKSTMDKLISSSIIPDNQSTEMMGFFLFVDQWLLWLPLLVYTLLNERGVKELYNVLVINVYLCISLVFLFMAGSYTNARGEVNKFSVYLETSGQVAAESNGDEDDVEDTRSQPTTQADVMVAEA